MIERRFLADKMNSCIYPNQSTEDSKGIKTLLSKQTRQLFFLAYNTFKQGNGLRLVKGSFFVLDVFVSVLDVSCWFLNKGRLELKAYLVVSTSCAQKLFKHSFGLLDGRITLFWSCKSTHKPVFSTFLLGKALSSPERKIVVELGHVAPRVWVATNKMNVRMRSF